CHMASYLGRRKFLAALGGAAAAWPLAARGQQRTSKIPQIGIIDDAATWDYFRQRLRDLGYIEGQTIAFEYRSAEGKPDRLAAVAKELAGIPVDLIATWPEWAPQKGRCTLIKTCSKCSAVLIQPIEGASETSMNEPPRPKRRGGSSKRIFWPPAKHSP